MIDYEENRRKRRCKKWKKTVCQICSIRYGVCRDAKTCDRHSIEEQLAFAEQHEQDVRNRRQVGRDRFFEPENQKRFDDWAERLEKRKEVRG